MAEDAEFSAEGAPPARPHDPGAELRAAEALEAALAREKETGQLNPSPELRDLDEGARAILEGMLEDIHRLRRHMEALGSLPVEGDVLGHQLSGRHLVEELAVVGQQLVESGIHGAIGGEVVIATHCRHPLAER